VAADLPAEAQAPRVSLGQARSMLNHCQAEARRAVWDLRSPLGESQPLRKGIEELAAPLVHPGGPAIVVRVEPEDASLRPLQQRHVLRIVEEALVNAVTHGQARCVEVSGHLHEGRLEIEVRDDGRGFESDRGVAAGHFGLLGMQERASLLGARLELESRPGAGTRVRLSLARDTA
jgi:signal transduction histidine kinase